ncbi:hypothetical protein OH77DRAFT_1430978, partial [Trametes cingulata]
FVGATKPTRENIEKLKPVCVRKSRIKILIDFLVANNPHYEVSPSPGNLAESRIQDTPSPLCQFSCGISTVHDRSLWTAQMAFEKYVQEGTGFNRSKKQRRAWQNGSDAKQTVYVLSSQMFFKRTPFTSRKEASISYPLHPWIEEAMKNTPYFANPDRPSILELQGDQLVDITKCDPPALAPGDLVWISFSVEFVIGVNFWNTTFTPYEIIRIGTVTPDVVGMAPAPTEPEEPRRRGIKAGDKVIMAEDFPMSDEVSSLSAGSEVVIVEDDANQKDNVRDMSTVRSSGPMANVTGPKEKQCDRSRSATPVDHWQSTPKKAAADTTATTLVDTARRRSSTPGPVSGKETATTVAVIQVLTPTKRAGKRSADEDIIRDAQTETGIEGVRITRSAKGKWRAV